MTPIAQKYLLVHAQNIYREAFSSAWKQYKDPTKRRDKPSREEIARRVVWASVEKQYKKSPEEKCVAKDN